MIGKPNAGIVIDRDMSLNLLAEGVAKCRECPLYKKGKACPGVGTSNATVMIVGQAPGIDESKLGQPFVGQAGQFLSDCLASIGIHDSMCFYTNIVHHFPGREGSGDACPPYAIEACKHWLEEEYKLVQPRLIVAVGAISMRFFGISGGININAGFVVNTEKWGAVLPILHPAGLLRPTGMKNTPQFMTQLNAVNTFLRGGSFPPNYTETL